MAVAYKFTWDKGSTINRSLTWKKNQGTEEEPNYQPVNLTGYTARMEIRNRYGGDLLHRLDTTNGGLTIDPEEGQILINVSAEVTTAWEWRNAVYDIELVAPDESVTRLIQGTITLSPEVTTGA